MNILLLDSTVTYGLDAVVLFVDDAELTLICPAVSSSTATWT